MAHQSEMVLLAMTKWKDGSGGAGADVGGLGGTVVDATTTQLLNKQNNSKQKEINRHTNGTKVTNAWTTTDHKQGKH